MGRSVNLTRDTDPAARASVAVVVPAYRSTPDLRACLSAVRALDPSPDEVVVVADGADEQVGADALAAGARVVLQEPRAGPAVARNTGAASTTSDLLLFLDADVEPARDVVDRVLRAFEEDPGVAAVIGSYDDEPPARNLASLYANLRHHYVHQHAREEGATFWGACGAIRREAFERIGGFDEDYVAPSIEDIELGYRLRDAGERIRVVKDLRVRHRKRWSARSLLTTDVIHRALPWSALILRSRRMENDLNVSVAERLKSVLTLGAVLGLLAAPRWPLLAVAAAAMLAVVLAANAPFLRFLAAHGGVRLAAWSAAWHLGYHLYTLTAFAASVLRQLVFGAQPAHAPWPGSPRRWLTAGPAPQLVTAGAGGSGAPPPTEWPEVTRVLVDRRRAHASASVTADALLRTSLRVRRWVPVVLLLAVGGLLLPAYRDGVQPDGLTYVRIAQYYAEGDLGAALNGYWGPLFSWLLAPWLAAGVEPLLAAKLLQLALAAAALLVLRRLCVRCGVRRATADGIALVCVPLLLHLALSDTYADLLLSVLLLLFVLDVLPPHGRPTGAGAWRAGWWAGLAFLAKPYALLVVVPVALLANLLAARRARRAGHRDAGRDHARRAAATVGACGLVVLVWSAVLSVHYGEPTVNRAWSYNVAVVAPGSAGQPLSRGLVEPRPGALFAWEDPSTMPLETDGWSASPEAAGRLLSNLGANLADLGRLVVGEFLFVPLFAFAGALVLLWRRRGGPPDARSAWPALALAVAVYLAGSLVTFVEPHYLWFAVLALVPLAAVALDLPLLRPRLQPGDRDYPAWRLAGFTLLAVGVTAEAALNLPGRPEGARIAGVAAEVRARAPGVAERLDGARVASAGDWEASSVLCFHLGCTYLGEAGDGEAALVAAARRADYVLTWGDGPAPGRAVVHTPAVTLYRTPSAG